MVTDTNAHSTAGAEATSRRETLHPPTAPTKLLRGWLRTDKYAVCQYNKKNTTLQAKQLILDKTFIPLWTQPPLENRASTAALPGSTAAHSPGVLPVGQHAAPQHRLSLMQDTFLSLTKTPTAFSVLISKPCPKCPYVFNSVLKLITRNVSDRKHITRSWKEMYRETVHQFLLNEAVTGIYKTVTELERTI